MPTAVDSIIGAGGIPLIRIKAFSTLIYHITLCFLIAISTCQAAKVPIFAATGSSELSDPIQAGADAANKAKLALGKRDVKLVLVFDSLEGDLAAKEKLLQGASSVFDSSLVYGCSCFGPITQNSNVEYVAVMAISGDIQVSSAVSDLTNGQKVCGKRIARDLLVTARSNKDKGSILLLLGDCHVPANDELVLGVKSILGEDFPIAGGAHPLNQYLYYKGKVVQHSNMGILIIGNFKCSFSSKASDNAHGVVETAGQAMREAAGNMRNVSSPVFVFDCTSRMQALGKNRPDELSAMKGVTASTPFIGIYGSGEIGPQSTDSPANGVGGHIVICAISSR